MTGIKHVTRDESEEARSCDAPIQMDSQWADDRLNELMPSTKHDLLWLRVCLVEQRRRCRIEDRRSFTERANCVLSYVWCNLAEDTEWADSPVEP